MDGEDWHDPAYHPGVDVSVRDGASREQVEGVGKNAGDALEELTYNAA